MTQPDPEQISTSQGDLGSGEGVGEWPSTHGAIDGDYYEREGMEEIELHSFDGGSARNIWERQSEEPSDHEGIALVHRESVPSPSRSLVESRASAEQQLPLQPLLLRLGHPHLGLTFRVAYVKPSRFARLRNFVLRDLRTWPPTATLAGQTIRMEVTPVALRHSLRAAHALKHYDEFRTSPLKVHREANAKEDDEVDDNFKLEGDYVAVRSKNGRPAATKRTGYVFLAGILLANITYGCFHLLAWNAPLHSHEELVAWRVSTIAVFLPSAVVPGLLVLVFGLALAIILVAIPPVFVVFLVVGGFVALKKLCWRIAAATASARVPTLDWRQRHAAPDDEEGQEEHEESEDEGPALAASDDSPAVDTEQECDRSISASAELGHEANSEGGQRPSSDTSGSDTGGRLRAVGGQVGAMGAMDLMPWAHVAAHLMMWPICVLFCISRLYIVAECFVSLGYAPHGVFVIPSWLSYFPHIS